MNFLAIRSKGGGSVRRGGDGSPGPHKRCLLVASPSRRRRPRRRSCPPCRASATPAAPCSCRRRAPEREQECAESETDARPLDVRPPVQPRAQVRPPSEDSAACVPERCAGGWGLARLVLPQLLEDHQLLLDLVERPPGALQEVRCGQCLNAPVRGDGSGLSSSSLRTNTESPSAFTVQKASCS